MPLSEEEWEKIWDLLEEDRWTRYPPRQVVEGLLYWREVGCKGEDLPEFFPPRPLLRHWWRKWQQSGRWDQILARLSAPTSQSRGEEKGLLVPLYQCPWGEAFHSKAGRPYRLLGVEPSGRVLLADVDPPTLQVGRPEVQLALVYGVDPRPEAPFIWRAEVRDGCLYAPLFQARPGCTFLPRGIPEDRERILRLVEIRESGEVLLQHSAHPDWATNAFPARTQLYVVRLRVRDWRPRATAQGTVWPGM